MGKAEGDHVGRGPWMDLYPSLGEMAAIVGSEVTYLAFRAMLVAG
jgi:hypothetical protein